MAQNKCTRTGLAVYNLISTVGWAFIFYQVVRIYPMVGQPAFFEITRNIVIFVQSCALIEIINSLFGIVRSPIVTTSAQVLSRLLVVIGIFQLLPETPAAHSTSYITLLLAWSITEVVRYLFYFFTLSRKNGPPKVLLLLRYNLFWVLYPTGVASELSIIYSALPIAERVYGPLYKYTLFGSMLTYIPGLPMLFMHMVTQRRKVMKSLKENPARKTN